MLTAKPSIILIVDDQPTNLKMLFSFLQESGFKVLVAKTGESALKKLQKVSPDLILLDVMMPGIDGFETCRRLKASAETKDIPVMFMTALSESMDKIKGLRAGAVDYITKPFQQEEVLARIENQIKLRKLQTQLEEQNQQLQQEISDRQKIEERLKLVIQAANDGFWDWNLESGELYISPRWKEILGYLDEELPNELATWENLVFPEDRIATLKRIEDYSTDAVSRLEVAQRFHHKDGSTVNILSRTIHVKDESGQVIRLIGAHTDITEITKAAGALQQSKLLLSGVLNSSLDGVAAFQALRDNQGNIIDFKWLLLNPAAEKMLGRTQSELVGKQLLAEMPENREIGLFERYVRVVETGEPLDTEHYYESEKRPTWLQIAAVKLDDGLAVTFRNITERKQMEERNRALLDAIPDTMFRQRVDGTYLDIQTKEGCLFALAETHIGRNLRDIPLPKDVKQGILEHLQAAVETGELQTYEYELLMPDGVHSEESRFVKSGADEAIRIVRDVTKRKRAEGALKESEARFRGIFEGAAIGIGLTGADGKLIAVNPTLIAFLGYSEAEMCDSNFVNVTHPDDRATDSALTQEVIDGVRDSFQMEKRYISKDGQFFWGRLTVSAVRNPEGEFQFTVAMVEDINDRKLRELALKESERRFRAIFNNSFQFTGLLKPNGTLIEVNQTALDFGGVKPTAVAGLPFWETCWWREGEGDKGRQGEFLATNPGRTTTIHPLPETLSPKQEQLRKAIATAARGQFVRYEVEVRGFGGIVATLDFSIKPVLDETGNVVLLIPEGRDITERKKAEERLRLLESAVVNANDAVLIAEAEPIDLPGPRIVYVNEAFTRMTGYSPEEMIGKTPRILQGPKTDRTQLDKLRQALATWQSVRVELINYRKDGSEFWVEFEVVPVADETGWFTHWVSVQRDITERKRAEQKLRETTDLYQQILDAIPDLVLCKGPQSRIIYANRAFREYYGMTLEQVHGIIDAPFVKPDYTKQYVKDDAYVFNSGQMLTVEEPIVRYDGQERLFSTVKSAIFNAQGQVIQTVGVCRDITERKQAEIEIAAANAALQRQILRVLLLERITQEIRSSLNPQQIFHTAATQIGQVFGVSRCIIHTYIADPFPRIPQVAEYLKPGYSSMMDFEIPVMGNPHAELVLSQDHAVASDDVYKDPLLEGIADIMQQWNMKSILLVRTSYQGKPNGIICLEQCDRFREWTAEEIELLEAVAAQMGIGLAQANLLEQETQRRQELDEQNHQLQQEISERQRAEWALQESQRFIEAIADANPNVLYVYDLIEQRNVYINRAIAALLGYTPKEVQEMGNSVFPSLMHPEDLARLPKSYQKFETAKDGDIIEFEYRMRRKDGSWCWLYSWDSIFARDSDGKPLQIIGTATDISDRKQAEIEIAAAKVALERQIHRTLLLGQITQEIRSSLNPDQIFQTAANQIGKAFGVNRCLIHTYIDYPAPRIPLVAEYKQPGLESALNLEVPIVGNPHAQLLLSQDCAIASDNIYTDPPLAAALSLCQQLGLKSLLAVRTSCQGKPNGAIGLHHYDGFRHWTEEEISLLESVAAQMGIAIAQANLLEQETQRRRELAAQNHALEKAKLEAEAANRAKSQFLSKMSHELRTPLNAILGFTQVLAYDPSLSTEHQEYISIINRSGEHLLELINDILSMSKIEAGQVTLNENPFDLYHLLDSLEEMLQLKASSKGLQLIVERMTNLPQYVQTDESKLRQVLINLLGNAIKFTQRGSVTLRVGMGNRGWGIGNGAQLNQTTNNQQQATIFFEVSDTGPGIAPNELGTLFDPFVQTETGRQSMEGTGLGLPISQQFVRMMGGEITVSSTLGQGAIFTFDIQVSLANAVEEKPLLSQGRVIGLEPNQPSYRILVVEDAAVNRKLLIKMLEPLEFEVREATNGQEGVALWESWAPHLIFMDIIMPVLDGYEATQQIKQTPKGQNTIIIALTASAFDEQREAILKAGCNDFIPKPFREDILFEKIANHLGVRYLYEADNRSTIAQWSTQPLMLTTDSAALANLRESVLSAMPTEWVKKLYQAALSMDDQLIVELIQQIPQPQATLANTLINLVDNFRLDIIIDCLEAGQNSIND